MDYEKKYKKALEIANNINNEHQAQPFDVMTKVFPELKESDDEKIRKDIIKTIERHIEHVFQDESYAPDAKDFLIKELKGQITWLEKQREQNPTDKVEPKFKVGDWIVDKSGLAQQVFDFRGGIYTCTYNSFTTDCESNYHLWTIQDAKDGDVLFHSDSASNGIFIFKELLKYEFSEEVICYCDYDSEDHFCLGEHHTCCWADAKILHPATKEQCDLLFSKMKESGYMWDAEKKELKKIEDEPIVIDEGKAEMDYCFTKMMNGEKVSSAWTEDDEKNLEWLRAYLKEYGNPFYGAEESAIDWLKSLKQRIIG